MDERTIELALHAIASQGILSGVLHAQTEAPIIQKEIDDRVDETLNLIRADLAADRAAPPSDFGCGEIVATLTAILAQKAPAARLDAVAQIETALAEVAAAAREEIKGEAQ
ncbi:hypothetical protein [Tateyamaria sp.]|uniref:hypothetical protein n=1 Tax=Tateyamaria sp. TaxID=1929288 RepID=UPI00329AAAC8